MIKFASLVSGRGEATMAAGGSGGGLAAAASWRPPRSCEMYRAELRLCKSLSNRFHHVYVYGETPNCSHWGRDLDLCREWETTGNERAKEALRANERDRVAEQRKHPPVWKLRSRPPVDWHLPLADEPADK
ncbi:synaptic plasticity regulator PANTS [Petromyzon marinus]|uniref:synaptic plasticity regulator PANTS n=1 Tax=Petromyzon marinus TaxID=7757 RepID=UPI003F6E6A1B